MGGLSCGIGSPLASIPASDLASFGIIVRDLLGLPGSGVFNSQNTLLGSQI